MKTRSLKQREQSRINGAKSGGPKTVQGKKVSRRNAVKHGVFSAVAFPEGEQVDEARRRETSLQEMLQPSSDVERHLVGEIADCFQRADRVARYLTAARTLAIDNAGDEDQDLKGKLRTLQSLKVRWEALERALEQGPSDGKLNTLHALLEHNLALEPDPEDPSSALRQMPTFARLREYWGLRSIALPPSLEQDLLRLVRGQRTRVAQMVAELHDRVSCRKDLHEELADSLPDERALRLASRYESMLARRMTARLDLILRLRHMGGIDPDQGPQFGSRRGERLSVRNEPDALAQWRSHR